MSTWHLFFKDFYSDKTSPGAMGVMQSDKSAVVEPERHLQGFGIEE